MKLFQVIHWKLTELNKAKYENFHYFCVCGYVFYSHFSPTLLFPPLILTNPTYRFIDSFVSPHMYPPSNSSLCSNIANIYWYVYSTFSSHWPAPDVLSSYTIYQTYLNTLPVTYTPQRTYKHTFGSILGHFPMHICISVYAYSSSDIYLHTLSLSVFTYLFMICSFHILAVYLCTCMYMLNREHIFVVAYKPTQAHIHSPWCCLPKIVHIQVCSPQTLPVCSVHRPNLCAMYMWCFGLGTYTHSKIPRQIWTNLLGFLQAD